MSHDLNLSDPTHSFDEKKHYNKVTFQQGKPILDVDLNDLSDALIAQQRSSLIEKMGYGPAQLDYREWAVTSVDMTPNSARNNYNFALSLGRIDTHKGVIDTNSYKGDALDSKIIFDYNLLVDAATNNATDRAYSNYIIKSKVTEVGTVNKIFDNSKSFNASIKLTGFDTKVTVSSDYNQMKSQVNKDILVDGTKPFVGRYVEEAARVVFLTGANAGESRIIASTDDNSITFSSPFTNATAIGDEYVVVPANTLQAYKTEYDATANRASSECTGLTNLPKLLMYLQVFEEDVSSEDDINIKSALLGYETTHRTQMRWCVRVVRYYESVDGDTDNNVNLSSLKLQHIFEKLSSTGNIEYQTLVDSIDETGSSDETYLQTTFWKNNDSTGTFQGNLLSKQVSPMHDVGITPMHFFTAKEASKQGLLWAFLKSCLLGVLDGHTGFNDVQILSLFNAESKTTANNANSETLSPIFYPGAYSNLNSDPVVHAFLSNSNNFKTSLGNTELDVLTSGSFMSPPRVLHTQAELSTDNMQSRTLFGFKGGVLYGSNAPLVFNSVNDHMSFLDQAVLSLIGVGYSYGTDADGNRTSSYLSSFTADSTSTTVETQAGYGSGAVKMVDILNQSSPTYTLRDKGSRSSHTVLPTDADLGWSFYSKDGNFLEDNNETNTTRRQWDEGIGQAYAMRESINFRKLAIKTTAHKSMDLFTISPRPLQQTSIIAGGTWAELLDSNTTVGKDYLSSTINVPYLLPFTDEDDNEVYNTYRDTYSALGKTRGSNIPAYHANLFMPNNKTIGNLETDVSLKTNYNARNLLERYQPQSSGVASYVVRDTNVTSNVDTNQYPLGNYYGPWNRFSFSEAAFTRSRGTTSINVPMDLWSNRCTAMRLRYHVGDFYPNGTDARGIPKNLLVDTLNLFVRIEPLSLTHWMTMPKHQHSILENSLVLADGIEALLKVSHGLGDTQKLLNASGQPLLQSESPYTYDAYYESDGTRTNRTTPSDNVDPMDLPFGHQNQPYVHWYHPAQNEMRYTDTQNADQATKKYTYYPKWGRRSLIIPAIVPFTDHYSQENLTLTTIEEKNNTLSGNQTSDTDIGTTNQLGTSTSYPLNSTVLLPESTLPYTVHASDPMAGVDNASVTTFSITNLNNGTITLNQNSITFPYIPNNSAVQHLNEPTPVFLPASRFYFKQDTRVVDSFNQPAIGFDPIMSSYSDHQDWSLSSKEDTYFPYSEQNTYWLSEIGVSNAQASDLPSVLRREFNEWSTPVMRSAIRTTTVAGICNLIRTKFENGLDDTSLASEYSDFTLSETSYTVSGEHKGVQVPGIGPDVPADTLFVGDTGTALSQVYARTGFMSPLVLGVGAVLEDGGLVHNNNPSPTVYRDSFDVYVAKTSTSDQLRKTFNSLRNMGLQIKLLNNCSFRVLHARPQGSIRTNNFIDASTAPKSLTEVFIGHDRTASSVQPVSLPTITGPNSKPFLHVASMNRGMSTTNPNKSKLDHLYSMVSDSTGGVHTLNTSNTSIPTDSDFDSPYNSLANVPNLTYGNNQRAAVGDTYAADPFDYSFYNALNPTANPLKNNDNLEANSGIEIDLIRELDLMHTSPSTYNIDTTSIPLQDMMPTSAELTLPGDHEIIFVLYTGHYGAKMYDTNDDIDTTHIAPVAGCHLTATIEINRPSERVNSTSTDEHHYGQSVDSSPVKTYSILSTK